MKLSSLFKKSETGMSIDHILDQGHKILRHQMIPPGRHDWPVHCRHRRTIEIAVHCCPPHRIDHGQQLDETRGLVMVIANNSEMKDGID